MQRQESSPASIALDNQLKDIAKVTGSSPASIALENQLKDVKVTGGVTLRQQKRSLADQVKWQDLLLKARAGMSTLCPERQPAPPRSHQNILGKERSLLAMPQRQRVHMRTCSFL
jgi:hypothetical protein